MSSSRIYPTESRQFGCDRYPLHYAVRTGNLEDVRYLVKVAKQSVNEQDLHDATPLYLAALTGNEEICQFLLENGAECDPESGGDAARVFYVALTPELRRMLKEWNLTAASRDPFLDILRKSFNDSSFADCFVPLRKISSEGGDEKIFLHYIILFARCPSLANMVKDEQNDEIELTELRLPSNYADSPSAVFAFFEYIYTGSFQTRDANTAMIVLDMARSFQLQCLHRILKEDLDKYLSNEIVKKSVFKCHALNLETIKGDMGRLAELVSTPMEDNFFDSELSIVLEWGDATIRCKNYTWAVNKFLCCAQSEYFKSAFLGNFIEAQEGLLDLSSLVSSSESVRLAIRWMYCDSFIANDVEGEEQPVTVEVALEILELGSAILCPRLCAHVANTILIPAVNFENVFGMLDLACTHYLPKLEDKCVETFATHLDRFAHSREFQHVIANEVAKTEQKGDILVTDIPIVAEIRSAILRIVTTAENNDEKLRAEQVRRLKLLQAVVLSVVDTKPK